MVTSNHHICVQRFLYPSMKSIFIKAVNIALQVQCHPLLPAFNFCLFMVHSFSDFFFNVATDAQDEPFVFLTYALDSET